MAEVCNSYIIVVDERNVILTEGNKFETLCGKAIRLSQPNRTMKVKQLQKGSCFHVWRKLVEYRGGHRVAEGAHDRVRVANV